MTGSLEVESEAVVSATESIQLELSQNQDSFLEAELGPRRGVRGCHLGLEGFAVGF